MDYKEIFDRYLEGELSGDELKEFEKSLQEEPDLARELDQYRRLNKLSEKIVESDIADRQAKDDISDYKKLEPDRDIDLQNFRESLEKAAPRRISPVWYAAAVILAGILTTAIVLLLRAPGTLPEIYASYYEEYHPSEKLFEFTRDNDDLYFAVQVYESGDFSRAILLFSQLADSTGFESYSSFYAGLIYIHQQKWEEAIESFIRVISAGDNDFLTDARWYLGLCYLKVENATDAREQFEIIAGSKNEYSKRARKILRHLD